MSEFKIHKRNVYHGTNSKFDKFDFERGGGMVHFAEKPDVAWRYANDTGSGSRNKLKWKDVRVEDVDSGDSFFFDPETKLWKSARGEALEHAEFQELMESGERYFDVYPKDARVIQRKMDMSKVLDTYPDRSKRYYEQANKQGLEAVLDIIKPSKIENTVNPQFTPYSQNIAKRLTQSAHDELKNAPGAPGFGNTFWSTSKHVMGDETREALKGVTKQLGEAGYDGIRFADDSHPTIAAFKEPELPLSLKKRGVKLLGQGLRAVGPVVGAGLALSAPSADAAIAEALGVEELGRSEEQKLLDQKYKERIRQRQSDLNSMVSEPVGR
jgi:hypothetical protein